MNVLFWQEPFWPHGGGMAVAAENLLGTLRRHGHEITVVTERQTGMPARGEWRGVTLCRFPFRQALARADAAEVAALKREIAALKRSVAPDVVHLGGIGPSCFFHLETGADGPAPVLLALHSFNTLSSAAPTSLARQVLEGAARVVACSAALLAEARRQVPAIEPVSSVIHPGAERERPIAAAPDAARLLCIGALEPHKGFDLAIRAVALLRMRHPAVRLRIAGSGRARAELEALARAEGVADRVEILGALPHGEVPAAIDASDIVVVPSRRESFGLVALEAALAARAVVASRVDGLAEVVADGQGGLLVEPGSASALADAIAALLADPARARALGAAARERARARFGGEACARAYEALYEEIRAGASAPGRSGAACG